MKGNQPLGRKDESWDGLPRDPSVKVRRFISQDLRKFWRVVRDNVSQAPEYLQELLEQLPELFAAIDQDDDRRNKREVYITIAKFLKDDLNLNQSLPICLNTVHQLCEETDSDLLEDGSPRGKQFVDWAKELILTIKVYYEPQARRMYGRKTEIYYIKDGQPASIKFPAQLDWDDVPHDIRRRRIDKGMETEVFKLYPKER